MRKTDEQTVNAMRILSADAIQKAKSGHPGMPLGASPIVFSLYANHLNFNPENPKMQNRDRFILSAGHGSMLLYSINHLFGYDITIEDIKKFRQFGSNTPGHPECSPERGIEATTGPLGAGASMACGMAIAEAHLAAIFNKQGYDIINNYTYVLLGDGCMMEGVSNEAFSLAGTLKLKKLIVLYDSNDITIEGNCSLAFKENTLKRMEAYGFYVQTVKNGNNIDEISKAIARAKKQDKPSFIKINTKIGYGCPKKEGKPSSHGEPLGEENICDLRKTLKWEYKEPFFVPDEIYQNCRQYLDKKLEKQKEYEIKKTEYFEKFPEMKPLWDKYFNSDYTNLLNDEEIWKTDTKAAATRNSSGGILNKLKDKIPNLIGGSADLAPSNKTEMKDAGSFSSENYKGRNIHFGVREMAMAGIANGIMLYGGLRVFISTFFVFSDFLKPMARLSALMNLPVTYIFTHDSIGVGEDGPTHEPVEHLAMLRSMPNFITFRPADAKETMAGWKYILQSKKTPVALVLSRQNLPQLENTGDDAIKGAYIVKKEIKKNPDLIIIASGSELSLALDSANELMKENIDARVVSMPSMELFGIQTKEYKESVLPSCNQKRLVIEALSRFGWGRYMGVKGLSITMDDFGASAPGDILFEKFGFTVKNVVKTAHKLLMETSDEKNKETV
ncbi:MAG: transketolase [Candidatus Gastranaerophilales bacterium]|nr:transketolase [Candidatus Gastranaerophilales bacterium]